MKTSTSIQSRHLAILTALCNLPTAPYCEQHVIAWLLAWAQPHAPHLATRRDKAGNVYLKYFRPGPALRRRSKSPLVLEAHMDHPGFIATSQKRDGTLEALFRGGVKPSHFQNAQAQFFLPDHPAKIFEPSQSSPLPITNYQLPAPPPGTWLPANILSVKTVPHHRHLKVLLQPLNKTKMIIPPQTLGMWNLPDAHIHKNTFAARVCDDLAGVAAVICLLDSLLAQKIQTHIIALFSRAEEVGFAGVLAACENKWLPQNSPIIGLETSKAFPTAPQGAGPIIRVGDRTGIFSPGLSHFLTQTAGHLADSAPTKSPFLYQRKLMDGGTCNSTAFAAYNYDSAGLCLALGNYHNMSIKGDIGYSDTQPVSHRLSVAAPTARSTPTPVAAKAGPGIASETINLNDFHGLIQLLIETTKRLPTYTPGWSFIRPRLAKMHRTEQKQLLYAK